MNSGIYRLTFSSGRFYIGKSIDIPKRWQQHEDKFSKNKAAQRMQAEYDQCGSPTKEVLMLCHADHIDIVETWIIDQFYQQFGNLMLNATYAESIADVDRLKINRNIKLLNLSTADHCELICDLQAELTAAAHETATARAKVKEYQECGILIPQEVLDQRTALQELCADYETEVVILRESLEKQKAEFVKYKQRTWWQRLWD